MENDTQSKPEPECHHKEDQEQQQQQQLARQQPPQPQPHQKPAVHVDEDDEDQQGQSTWVAYLETERNRRFDPVDSSFMSIFRDLLRSNAVNAAHDAAHAIDQAFAGGWLPQRSMLKHGGDEGLADFVHLVYNLIFELAPLLAHDSAQHVRLFELLVELRKLPPRSFKLNSVHETFLFFSSLLSFLVIFYLLRRFPFSEAELSAYACGQMHYTPDYV